MPAFNRGRATLNSFVVAIKHQRKIVINAVAADANKQSGEAMSGYANRG
jgi:hypothetical protein